MASRLTFFNDMTPATKGNLLKGTSIAMNLGIVGAGIWFALLSKNVISGPAVTTELKIGMVVGVVALWCLAFFLLQRGKEQHKDETPNDFGFVMP